MWICSKTKLFLMMLGGLPVLTVLIHQESCEMLTQDESCQTFSRQGEWLLLQRSAQCDFFFFCLKSCLCGVLMSFDVF